MLLPPSPNYSGELQTLFGVPSERTSTNLIFILTVVVFLFKIKHHTRDNRTTQCVHWAVWCLSIQNSALNNTEQYIIALYYIRLNLDVTVPNTEQQFASININQHQLASASICINQHQSAPIIINQHKYASISTNQHKSVSTSINLHQ